MPYSKTAAGVAVFALIGLLAAPAAADEITHKIDVANGGLNYHAGDAGSFAIPQFDDQGGSRKLHWVTFVLRGTSFGGCSVLDNEGPFTGEATVGIGVDIAAYSTTVRAPVILQALCRDTKTGLVGPDDPAEDLHGLPLLFGGIELNADFAGPDSIAAGQAPVSDETFVTLDAADWDLSEFIGTGAVEWNFTSSLFSSGSSSLSPFQATTELADFNLELTVIYGLGVGAPEPGTMALLATGGLVALLRRRRPSRP